MAEPGASRYIARRPVFLGLAKGFVLAASQFSFASAAPYSSSHVLWAEKKVNKSENDAGVWLDVGLAIFLVLLGGVFAGLTIALMGQDEIYLQVIKDSGEGKEKQHASSVLRLLHRGKHWVLVTLLLGNVITNETLPIVLDKFMGGGWPAVLGSTVLVVIFGEIAPQSVCVRFGLPIGAWMSPFVLVLMYLMAPVAWPTAKLLDYLLGADHGTVYKKAGLKTLVSLHRSLGEAGQRLHADEVTIISAVLDLKEKTVGSIMTPMDNVFTLSLDDVLDEETMDDILSQGYSRIPVHHPDNDGDFVGMLLVKMLITYDPEDAKPVRDFALATLPETKPDTSCLDIVNFFQEGKSHMVMVSDHPGEDHGTLGVVTLEDVIEELIGEEIVDESDVFIDVNKQLRRGTPAPRARFPKALQKVASKIKVEPGAVVNGANGTDLINIDEHEPLKAQEIQQRLSPLEPPNPEHVPHRRSSNQSILGNLGEVKTPKKLANADDLKEHLKHLGPSNLASRPKTTRYASVKIKPGTESNPITRTDTVARTDTVTRTNTGRNPLARRVSETTSEYGGGIGEGLLPSGGRVASDGVQALAVGYGAISTSPNNERRPASAHKAIQPGSTALDGPTEAEENKASKPFTQTDDSDDKVGDLPAGKHLRSPYFQSRGPARSGSITENIIDINGVRKLVLETTSSSESNGDEGNNESGSKRPSESSERKAGGSQQSASQSKTGGGHDEGDGNSGSKKKKRRKKKAKGDSDETQPLLH